MYGGWNVVAWSDGRRWCDESKLCDFMSFFRLVKVSMLDK